MTLTISIADRDVILGAARASADEVCGLLLGRAGHVERVVACANVAQEPARRFEIDPVALIAVHRAARVGGAGVIGHYHSHPSGVAHPSPRDAAEAVADGSMWIVVAGGAMTAWRAVTNGAVHGRFDAVELVVDGLRETGRVATRRLRRPVKVNNSMTISPVDFASLLCSRLCHDLLSPVGALNNGLELLNDETDPAMRARCMELLNESARVSANKLKFFRLAFGAAGGFGERVDVREARVALEGLLGDNKRLTLQWLVEQTELSKPAVKVLLNLGMIAGDTLVRGGTVTIGAEETADTTEIVLRAEGPRTVLDPELRATLVDGATAESVTPRAAAAYLVNAIATEVGGSVMVSEPVEGTMLFGAALPMR